MTLVNDKRIAAIREQLKYLRDIGRGNIRVHPNGFIQIDLDSADNSWHESHQRGHSGGMRRVHVWNPPGFELPHQATVNEIHDHVFDMRSTVIRGRLTQLLYRFVTGDASRDNTHELYRAIYNKSASSRLEPLGIRGYLEKYDWFEIIPDFNNPYTQPAFTFHDSWCNDCVVTIMEKTQILDGDATVICEIGKPPDNSFDRASVAESDFLWDAVEAALK